MSDRKSANKINVPDDITKINNKKSGKKLNTKNSKINEQKRNREMIKNQMEETLRKSKLKK